MTAGGAPGEASDAAAPANEGARPHGVRFEVSVPAATVGTPSPAASS